MKGCKYEATGHRHKRRIVNDTGCVPELVFVLRSAVLYCSENCDLSIRSGIFDQAEKRLYLLPRFGLKTEISQASRADETLHFFDCGFYPTD